MARLHSVTLNGKQCPWIRGASQGIRSTWLLAALQKQETKQIYPQGGECSGPSGGATKKQSW